MCLPEVATYDFSNGWKTWVRIQPCWKTIVHINCLCEKSTLYALFGCSFFRGWTQVNIFQLGIYDQSVTKFDQSYKIKIALYFHNFYLCRVLRFFVDHQNVGNFILPTFIHIYIPILLPKLN
jgi:hypothetical protein